MSELLDQLHAAAHQRGQTGSGEDRATFATAAPFASRTGRRRMVLSMPPAGAAGGAKGGEAMWQRPDHSAISTEEAFNLWQEGEHIVEHPWYQQRRDDYERAITATLAHLNAHTTVRELV